MERGLDRFIVGTLAGVLLLAGSAQAQQAGSYLPIDQLTAVMLGQDDEMGVVAPKDEIDLTETKPLLGILEGIQAKGNVNVGYSFNFNDSENSGNTGPETPTRIFDTFHNEVTVHNAILYLEKPVDDDNLIGFAFTPSVGKDSAVTQDANLSFGGDDLDILQANIQLYAPDEIAVLGGTTFEIGKFLTNAGAEVIDAPYNDMFSRTWLFGLAIPFVHTGVRATKTVVEHQDGESLIGLSLGVVNGWGNHGVGSAGVGDDSNGNFPTWLSSVFITPGGPLNPSLTVNYFVGETSATGEYRNLVDIVASIQPVENLTISANFDWVGDEYNANVEAVDPTATPGYSQLWGFAGIVRYDFDLMGNDRKNCYVAFRGEYLDNRDQWTAPSGLTSPAVPDDMYSFTWTLGYKPVNNLLLRTEVRYDQAGRDGSTGASRVFESGEKSHQTTLSFDVSLLF